MILIDPKHLWIDLVMILETIPDLAAERIEHASKLPRGVFSFFKGVVAVFANPFILVLPKQASIN